MALKTSTEGLCFAAAVDELSKCSKYNHAPRMAGLALLDAETRTRVFGGVANGECTNVRILGEGDANISVHLPNDDAEVDLQAGGCWDPTWSRDVNTRIIIPALDHALVPSCVRELHRLGRACTFTEPCITWELPAEEWDAVCCGGTVDGRPGPWVTDESLNELAVGQAYGVPTETLRLCTLTVDDAPIVNDTWKYRTNKSIDMIRAGILHRPTAALREVSSGRVVSWITCRYDGSMGILYTIPEFRGLGLAKHVVKFLALQIRRWQYRLVRESEALSSDPHAPEEMQATAVLAAKQAARLVPYCHIKIGNVQSEAVFQKLGFKEVGTSTWVVSSALASRFRLRPMNLGEAETGVGHELQDLLNLINTSYKQDDAFFVDQTRTSVEVLRDMCDKGVFLVGYKMDPTTADGLGVGLEQELLHARNTGELTTKPLFSYTKAWAVQRDVPQPACQPHAAELTGEQRELLTAVYVTVTEAACVPVEGSTGEISGRTAQISMLTINPVIKKQGVGQRVLDFVLAWARAPESEEGLGCTAIEAFVVSVKPWLLAWYTDRNGFQVVGREDWPTPHELILPCFFHKIRKQLV